MLRGAGELASISAGQAKALLHAISTDERPAEAMYLRDAIREMIEYALALDLVDRAGDVFIRFWMLIHSSVDLKPSSRAATFLKLVSRCFLSGFYTECVVMCRGVLDVELEERISDDDCEKFLGSRRQGFSLTDHITVANRQGRISDDATQMAHDIRIAGNGAVHREPETPDMEQATGMIQRTLSVIQELGD